nr:hypothetical protein [Tanacetum cinerariifolium]
MSSSSAHSTVTCTSESGIDSSPWDSEPIEDNPQEAEEDPEDEPFEEEELPALATSTLAIVDLASTSEETEPSEEDKVDPTPPSPISSHFIIPLSQTRLRRARKLVRSQTPLPPSIDTHIEAFEIGKSYIAATARQPGSTLAQDRIKTLQHQRQDNGNRVTRIIRRVEELEIVGHDAAYGIPQKTLMKMITKTYYLRSEIKKLETKLWNFTIKGTDVDSYTQRFQELVLLCSRMQPKKQPPYKRLNVAKAYTTGPGEKREYAGTLPLCNKCKFHHNGYCAAKKLLRVLNVGINGTTRVICPKLKNKNHGNATRNGKARGRAYALGGDEANPNLNIIMGTFLLNDHYASILFDIGIDRSFVSTTFSSLIDITPSTLDNSYDKQQWKRVHYLVHQDSEVYVERMPLLFSRYGSTTLNNKVIVTLSNLKQSFPKLDTSPSIKFLESNALSGEDASIISLSWTVCYVVDLQNQVIGHL